MTQLSNLLVGKAQAGRTVVFSGGACSAITAEGKSARNTARDSLNAWLDSKKIAFFEPQIHPDTHGRKYVYEEDGPAEQAARAAATVTLYQIGDESLAGVTAMEVVRDSQVGKNVVLWLSGGRDAKGKPAFRPTGNLVSDDPCVAAHLAEYVKAGTNIRKNLIDFVRGQANVTVVTTESEAREAIEKYLQN